MYKVVRLFQIVKYFYSVPLFVLDTDFHFCNFFGVARLHDLAVFVIDFWQNAVFRNQVAAFDISGIIGNICLMFFFKTSLASSNVSQDFTNSLKTSSQKNVHPCTISEMSLSLISRVALYTLYFFILPSFSGGSAAGRVIIFTSPYSGRLPSNFVVRKVICRVENPLYFPGNFRNCIHFYNRT